MNLDELLALIEELKEELADKDTEIEQLAAALYVANERIYQLEYKYDDEKSKVRELDETIALRRANV